MLQGIKNLVWWPGDGLQAIAEENVLFALLIGAIAVQWAMAWVSAQTAYAFTGTELNAYALTNWLFSITFGLLATIGSINLLRVIRRRVF